MRFPFLTTLPLTLSTSTHAFTFHQTHNGRTLDSIPESQFLSSPFSNLCPSQNCFKDCLNDSRLFQAIPDQIDPTVPEYGQPDHNGNIQPTFFGVCTNLLSAHRLVISNDTDNPDVKPIQKFFTIEKEIVGVTDIFRQVALGITACVADTCSQTRHPERCSGVCSLRSLLENDVREVDWEGGMLDCVRRLCGSARVLPYANQDVLGIGVLISYYIQGILLLLAAAVVAVLASRSWLRGGQGSIESSVVRKLESPMATFLTAETYFSISTAIAAFIMSPRAIDPLNGYALMVVAIVGFLCPVFTLLLLRCLTEARVTRFGTVLTVVSWFLNTVLFFLLLPNLSTFGDDVAEDALKQLFSIPTCGDSSAMSLCQQLTGNNPLRSLTGFFERSSWTNIRTVPMVWTFATAILIVLVSEKVCRMAVGFRCRERPARGKEQETVYSRLGETRQERSSSQDPHSHRTGRLIVSVVFIVLCSVCLGYTFHMVVRFRGIDAIDIQGWSFGQVVAAIFWVPVFLDVAHSIFTSDAALST